MHTRRCGLRSSKAALSNLHTRCLDDSSCLRIKLPQEQEVVLVAMRAFQGNPRPDWRWRRSRPAQGRRPDGAAPAARCLMPAAIWPPPADDARRVAEPVFWAYLLAEGMSKLGAGLLDTSLMPVVFDLDETLLQASSVSQLKNRMEHAKKAKCAAAALAWAALEGAAGAALQLLALC
jgi:hypothetical protein